MINSPTTFTCWYTKNFFHKIQGLGDDEITLLGLANPLVVRASFDRPEIFYRVETKRDLRSRIEEFVAARPDRSGIIYRATRADVEKTAGWLTARGVSALPYHAGLPDEVRHEHQERFKRDEISVIVATVAFGMGIDKPDIRYVVHGDLPKTLEAWYQETGRAGRDGDPAEALLLWGAGDLAKARFHISNITDPAEKDRAGRRLRAMAQFAGSYNCRHKAILAHFDNAMRLGVTATRMTPSPRPQIRRLRRRGRTHRCHRECPQVSVSHRPHGGTIWSSSYCGRGPGNRVG